MIMQKIINIIKKNKSVILYLFFGACTTAINVICYYLLCHLLEIPTVAGTIISWFVSVVFAYITNSIFVFESKATGFKNKTLEIIEFFLGRVATGVLDTLIMFVTVDLLHYNGVIWKIISNIIVIILNYVIGKWIFKKK